MIGGYDESSVDMGPRRDASLAEGAVLVETLGAVRSGGLVQAIGSFEFVGTDKAYFSKLTRVASNSLKGIYIRFCVHSREPGGLPLEPSSWRGTSVSEDIPSGRQQPRYAVDTHQNRFTRPCSLLFLCFSLCPACV